MAVIDICSSADVVVESGSIGFGFNPEMTVTIPRSLFDAAAAINDTVIYRVDPTRILYKGIVRSVRRTLTSETVTLVCSAAESVLEAKGWTPAHAAYNQQILCRNIRYNATIQDFFDAEYTGNATGPQTWFTEVVIPPSVASLQCGPTETYQASFLTLVQSIIAIHPQVQWMIEYDDADTTVLPVGKLILVDTKIGRTTVTLDIGSDILDADFNQDASNATSTLRIYGGGDFVEKEEVLTPAWDPNDEVIPAVIYVTAPTERDLTKADATYIAWGYDVTSNLTIKVTLGGDLYTLFANKEYTFDPSTGTIYWNQYNGSIHKVTGVMVPGDPPDSSYRKMAYWHPSFLGASLEISYTFCGPDCYRLYAASEPIAALRLRLSKVPDVTNPGNFVDMPVEQDTVVEAFSPRPLPDFDDPHYQTLAGYSVAKVLVPDSSKITWDATNPDISPAEGYSVFLGSPEFQEGRRCVRFADRQLMVSSPALIDMDNPPTDFPKWRTWQIMCRYTAWRNLEQVRSGNGGADYEARFVFMEQIRYQTVTQPEQAVARAVVTNGVITSVVPVLTGDKYASAPVVTVRGDGTGAVVVANMTGGKVTSYTVSNGGSGYTTVAVLVGSTEGIIRDDTPRLVTLANETLDFYGNPIWEGTMVLSAPMGISGSYKVTTLPVNVGDKILLGAGNVDAALKNAFVGIVNQLDIASLESGSCSIGISPRMPNRNPFEARPPVFVDAERNGALIADIYATQRRSS